MPDFDKSKSFQLKSGNKANAPFKMMGSSPLQQREVTTGYLGDDISAKRVVNKKNSGNTIVKEIERQYNANYLGHEPEDMDYNGKKVWTRKFKSKTDADGNEKRRKEKILFDDGSQMIKRKQRIIKYGKHKGKVLSKTISWKDQKRSVKKEYIDKIDTSKL